MTYITSSQGVKDNDGFVSGINIVKEMASQGFRDEQIRAALVRLAARRLIETPHAHYRELDVGDDELPDLFHYRTTSVGIYHIMYWTGAFSFLDAVSIDTPIFDGVARGIVFKHAASAEISDRLDKAEIFRKYLETQWHIANINTSYYDFLTYVQAQQDGFKEVRSAVPVAKRRGVPRSIERKPG
jgi:DNA-binding transcriptional regulator PaaX